MPPKIVLGPISMDKTIESTLGKILSNRCFQENGKYILKLPVGMLSPSYWQPLVEAVGYEEKPDLSSMATGLAKETAKRLKIIYPGEKELIVDLEESECIRGYVGTDPGKASLYLKIFAAYAALRQQESTTLSQLGSNIFNDSKALRTVALLGQLDKLLRIAHDQPDMPIADLHANCGIIDNPYTSHVVIFAPFCYTTSDGCTFDYPKRLFQAGQAAVLPWETVQRISEVRTEGAISLVSSENAAPFLKLVQAGTPCLYTEGYPNSSVKVLLTHFGNADAHAVHFGDTDLDGYRIAEQISRCITIDGLYNHDRISTLPHKPLSETQRVRLESFIEHHPDFRFKQELQHTLEHGWVEQESLGWLSPET
jgi:hypothetical protein